jgi:hypothetical protein
MEKKQTAVQWLEERYKKNINLMQIDFDQAKAMEKQQSENDMISFMQFIISQESLKNTSGVSVTTAKYYLEKFLKKHNPETYGNIIR